MAGELQAQGGDSCSPQRQTLKALQGQWEVELLRVLRHTKATMAYQAREGQPTLYPFLCLLSEEEFVSMLMQVGWGGGSRSGGTGLRPGSHSSALSHPGSAAAAGTG